MQVWGADTGGWLDYWTVLGCGVEGWSEGIVLGMVLFCCKLCVPEYSLQALVLGLCCSSLHIHLGISSASWRFILGLEKLLFKEAIMLNI